MATQNKERDQYSQETGKLCFWEELERGPSMRAYWRTSNICVYCTICRVCIQMCTDQNKGYCGGYVGPQASYAQLRHMKEVALNTSMTNRKFMLVNCENCSANRSKINATVSTYSPLIYLKASCEATKA